MKKLNRSDFIPNGEAYDPYSDLYGYNMAGFERHEDEEKDVITQPTTQRT